MFVLFFFKQKTAYEMRISDWSSDVCASDLEKGDFDGAKGWLAAAAKVRPEMSTVPDAVARIERLRGARIARLRDLDRKSVVSGKSVSVRVDLGCRRIIKTKIH